MTRSLSNLIKAYSIKYNEDNKKTIDLNDKENEFQKMYLDKLGLSSLYTESFDAKNLTAATIEGDGFVAGLHPVASVEEINEENHDITALEEEYSIKKQQMEDEASEILKDARRRANEILEQAKKDAENLRNSAREEGYNAGTELAKSEILQKNQELLEEKKKLESDYNEKLRELEPKFVELLIAFIKKLTNYAMEEKEEIILYLIEQAFQGSDASNSYIVKVSSEDYELVSLKKPELLWQLKEGVELEIVEDPLLSKAQCLIETDSRVIDCSLDVQLKNLICDLRLLAGTSSRELLGDIHD